MTPSSTLFVPAGTNEELAGPPRPVTPTGRGERISSIDVVRGVALLGILLANVTSFGLPEWAYSIPLGTPLPVFEGPHATVNTVVWFARWFVMEGKMRGLFSMLFGAGVVLLTSRAEQRGAGDRVADIFLRRNMWLVLFGVLHAYFVWFGDILYFYGLTALLFLYPCRHLRARTLIVAGIAVLCVNIVGPFNGAALLKDEALSRAAAAPTAKPADIAAWNARQEEWKPPRTAIEQDLAATRAGYLSDQRKDVPNVVAFERDLFYAIGFCDMLGMMLLGMGLFKTGFLPGRRSARTYAVTALVFWAISASVVGVGTWKAYASGFDLLTTDRWLFLPLDLGRATGSIAIAATTLLVLKLGVLRGLTRRLAAVGQMALSNYLLTSVLCKFIFVWGPWKLYGALEYYQLYFVVAAVWCVNLLWSPIWLRRYEFGPAEWLWRSLTYWKRQPMRADA
jgi:uncharacterized protein